MKRVTRSTIDEIKTCAESWEPEARLIGNVKAGDIATFVDQHIALEEAVNEMCALQNEYDQKTMGCTFPGNDYWSSRFMGAIRDMTRHLSR